MKPITALIILDDFGYREEKQYNAILTDGAVNFMRLWKTYPHTLIGASGMEQRLLRAVLASLLRHPDQIALHRETLIGLRVADSALAELLNANGIQAVPAAAERIDNESAYALQALGLEAPRILDDARDKQFILVDHSSYAHAIDYMAQARIVGILDHHGMGDVKSAEVIPVFSMPVGATGSLI